MTDFVLQVVNADRPCDRGKMLDEIANYAKFLKQPLTLEMFVPCDDDGNILRNPIPEHMNYRDYMTTNKYEVLQENYKKAKQKVLFKDLFIKDDKIIFPMHGYVLIEMLSLSTIDNLTYKEINLTQSAIKQIGL